MLALALLNGNTTRNQQLNFNTFQGSLLVKKKGTNPDQNSFPGTILENEIVICTILSMLNYEFLLSRGCRVTSMLEETYN